MKSNNTISINGRLYDAKTGLPLSQGNKQPTKAPAESQKVTPKQTHQRTVDGFAVSKRPLHSPNRRTSKKPASASFVQVTAQPKKATAAPKPATATRKPHAVGPHLKHKASHSVTLHRRSVIKPDLTQPETDGVSSTAMKLGSRTRSSRINSVVKSSAISRFGTNKQLGTATASNAAPENKLVEIITPEAKVASVSDPLSTKEQLINKALGNVTMNQAHPKPNQAHKKTARGFHKLHIARYGTSVLVTMVLVGYVAYLNVPSLSMKVAAYRAGFAASLPSYNPAGYALSGPIESSPGQVTINFSSNTDSRTFTLKQQPTTWDSAALLENYVVKQSSDYRIWQDGGLTIYMYEGSSASWVNGGKMYHVEGKNSQLDADQLLKLAGSV